MISIFLTKDERLHRKPISMEFSYFKPVAHFAIYTYNVTIKGYDEIRNEFYEQTYTTIKNDVFYVISTLFYRT